MQYPGNLDQMWGCPFFFKPPRSFLIVEAAQSNPPFTPLPINFKGSKVQGFEGSKVYRAGLVGRESMGRRVRMRKIQFVQTFTASPEFAILA
jgi:hypothetical protein